MNLKLEYDSGIISFKAERKADKTLMISDLVVDFRGVGWGGCAHAGPATAQWIKHWIQVMPEKAASDNWHPPTLDVRETAAFKRRQEQAISAIEAVQIALDSIDTQGI